MLNRLLYTTPLSKVAKKISEESQYLHECACAHVGNLKQANAPVAEYSLAGRLYLSKSGWLMLSVPNALVRGAFDALDEPGVELPSGKSGKLTAHISVIRPDELDQIGGGDKIIERGHSFNFTLGPVKTVTPHGWPEMSKVWFIDIHSPALENLRKSYGLSPRPKNNRFRFHLTFGVRRKHVLRHNDVSKSAEDLFTARCELEIQAYENLLKQADENLKTITVDLDNTLAEHYINKHEEHFGPKRKGTRKALKELKHNGYKIAVVTCRTDESKVRGWLNENGIPFDCINEEQPVNGLNGSVNGVWPKILNGIFEKDGGFLSPALRIGGSVADIAGIQSILSPGHHFDEDEFAEDIDAQQEALESLHNEPEVIMPSQSVLPAEATVVPDRKKKKSKLTTVLSSSETIDKLAAEKDPELVVDRPKGFKKVFRTSKGSKELVYPMDYGYYKGLINPQDQEDVDVFSGTGGPHHGRFMKGNMTTGAWLPDEHKYYSGLHDQELQALKDWWTSSHDPGVTKDWITFKDKKALLADVLSRTIKSASAREIWNKQTTTFDDGATYNVGALYNLAKARIGSLKEFPISELEHELKWWDGNKEHARATDTSFPLLVINTPTGPTVADGLNRLWKAKNIDKSKTIHAYVLPQSALVKSSAIKIPLPEVMQDEDFNCGPAALKAILDYYGEAANLEELTEEADSDPDGGTTPPALIALAKKHNMNVHEFHKMSLEDLKAQLDLKHPVLVCMQTPEDTTEDERQDDLVGHYVTVIGYDNENVYFEDPATGEQRGVMSFEEFDENWHDEDKDGTKYDHYGIAIWKSDDTESEDKEVTANA